MIEGSPFNVDSIDFIDAFGIQEGMNNGNAANICFRDK